MAILEFSPGLLQNFANRVFEGNTSVPNISTYALHPVLSYNSNLPGWPANLCYIRIYKGTVPTDFSTITSGSSRSSDTLITYTHDISNSHTITNSRFGVNPVALNTIFIAASASGTATWFRISNHPYPNGNIVVSQMVGTIGLPGSGSDLEIADTNIVSGKFYKLVNLRIAINVPSQLNI